MCKTADIHTLEHAGTFPTGYIIRTRMCHIDDEARFHLGKTFLGVTEPYRVWRAAIFAI
jgi:hypothetical protein